MAFAFAGQWGPEPIVDRFGNAVYSATFRVLTTGGAEATVYTDRTKATTVSQPLDVDGEGNATFYAVPGRYTVELTAGGSVTLFPVGVVPDAEDVESAADIDARFAATGRVFGVAEDATPAQIQARLDEAAAVNGTVVLPATVATMELGTTGLVLPPRTCLASLNPHGTTLRYTGSGAAVTYDNQRSSLVGIRVLVDSTSATAVGVHFASFGTQVSNWRMRNVTVSAASKVTGQVGVLVENNATGSVRWGVASGAILVENFDTGVKFITDATLGNNANRWLALKMHNCTTCIDVDAGADTNQFLGLQSELFTTGIRCAGKRNVFQGQVEGGGGDKAYELTAASQENVLDLVASTGASASTDEGTGNLVTLPGIGQIKAWDEQPKWIATFHPYFADGDGTVPAGANNGQFLKVDGITRAQSLTTVRYEVTVQSGNMELALFELVGTDLIRRATTGTFLVPAAGGRQQGFTAAYTVQPGKTYYIWLGADNVTAKFKAKIGVSTNLLDVSSGNVPGKLLYARTGGGYFPVPATVPTADVSQVDSKAFALIAK